MARRILPADVLTADMKPLFETMRKEADFPCAVLATAFLENALLTMLGAFFIKDALSETVLSETSGILDGFGKCAKMACCLGFISGGALKNLQTIAKIRNRFAHSHKLLTFKSSEIRTLCDSLHAPFVKPKVGADKDKVFQVEKSLKNSRIRFVLVCLFMISTLTAATSKIEQKQKLVDFWDRKS